MVSISQILCPIDFSDFSLDALRHGLVLAQWYSAQLTLFHVYQVSQPLPVEGTPGGVPVFVAADPNKRPRRCAGFALHCSTLPVRA